jgi:hypothetical protein
MSLQSTVFVMDLTPAQPHRGFDPGSDLENMARTKQVAHKSNGGRVRRKQLETQKTLHKVHAAATTSSKKGRYR